MNTVPTLLRPYTPVFVKSVNITADKMNSGKPAGTNVSWYDTKVIRFLNYTAEDDGQDYWIKSAEIKMDWSDWYKP